jgi:A/G-specific adenine glycosylase
VLDYYQRFLRAFPSIISLARADEQQVLAQWSGLGYYRRARMMHAAAKELAGKRKKLPRSSEELRELPGIGRYTAAAIASICFGERIAVVDGNVERVLNRIGGHDESDSLDFWASAQALIHADRPGDFNQAMMELGATVCLPKVPDCMKCPVKKWCKTRGAHVTAKRSPRRSAHLNYLLAHDESSVALVQRGQSSHVGTSQYFVADERPIKTEAEALHHPHGL